MLENPNEEIEKIKAMQLIELQNWLETHPNEEIPMEMRRDPEAEIAELFNMHSEFETKYSLEELHAIENADDINYQKRLEAIEDLKPLTALRMKIKKETTISEQRYEDELFTSYKRLSQAVGVLSNGKIDHTR